ncbi:hypothetical protein GOP47_0017981 [Adiantum capillus-veneris]|uniref:Uncharacterized protein n=1 Tax=Adiantum capillus-veneris TaxID=13818 RepID=A0A9D4UGF5_ADICA|nr:hypothetical protein GOP47_0017981 [Adiantum capillus-veneris]
MAMAMAMSQPTELPELWSRAPLHPPSHRGPPLSLLVRASSRGKSSSIATSSAGDGSSYLGMWKRAKDRDEQERLQLEKQKEQEASPPPQQDLERRVWDEKSQKFTSLLQVPAEERDRVQRMQVVDRAAAALAAANALLAEQASFRNTAATLPPAYAQAVSEYKAKKVSIPSEVEPEGRSTAELTLGAQATPGPDFWTWSPPPDDDPMDMSPTMSLQRVDTPRIAVPALLEKEPITASLAIPLESEELSSIFQQRAKPSLPPLQSLLEIKEETSRPVEEESAESILVVPDVGVDIASFVQQESLQDAKVSHGVSPDGARWWKETGKELRQDGVTCKWTVIRGTNMDGIEWEEKFWEAYDDFDYKELGAEKSGRDAAGNVWREFWKESMWQDLTTGLLHMEKTADKWGRNGQASEWHEKWWEHYNASGFAEKWADKWCKIDESTALEPGHAHVWHERWGEKFNGQGAAVKYTDKWAERAEYGGGRSKWGDKWDENFNEYEHGVKQGETWWEGPSGERWNRTWGEKHNGSGWVHKYGKSSSGEHWDTHQPQDTWYERHPHFGFDHCLENSRELRRVGSKREPTV